MKYCVVVLCASLYLASANPFEQGMEKLKSSMQNLKANFTGGNGGNGTESAGGRPDMSAIFTQLKEKVQKDNNMTSEELQAKIDAGRDNFFQGIKDKMQEKRDALVKQPGKIQMPKQGMRMGPPFLQNVTAECLQSFHEMCQSLMNTTVPQMKTNFANWGKECDRAEEIANMTTQMEALEETLKANITKLVETLPVYLDQLEAIEKNESLTIGEMMKAQMDLLKNFEDKNVAKIIMVITELTMKDAVKSGKMDGFGGFGGMQPPQQPQIDMMPRRAIEESPLMDAQLALAEGPMIDQSVVSSVKKNKKNKNKKNKKSNKKNKKAASEETEDEAESENESDEE